MSLLALRRRAAVPAALLLLFILTAGAHSRLRRLQEEEAARTSAALEVALGRGEIIGASLLGGFRSIAINVLWIRILDRLDHQRFDELALLYRTLEVVQPSSPFVYGQQAETLAFDVARKFVDRPEERWGWIRRGLEALERGRRKFPASLYLREVAAGFYYERFHTERSPLDRERFLREAPPDKGSGGIVRYGADPLDLAREAAESALLIPNHNFLRADTPLAFVYREIHHQAAKKQREPALAAYLRSMEGLIRHVEGAHLPRAIEQGSTLVEELISDWKAQMAEARGGPADAKEK